MFSSNAGNGYNSSEENGNDEESSSSSLSSSPASDIVDRSGGNTFRQTTSNATGLDSISSELNAALLDEFRQNWQCEIKSSAGIASESNNKNEIQQDPNKHEINRQLIAEGFFRNGIELERSGKVYDAIKFYKKAEQLVPDIEFKFYEASQQHASLNTKHSNNKIKRSDLSSESLLINLSTRELISKFHLDLSEHGNFISSNRETGVVGIGAHISELPMEILIYIMRWVVSAELDLRSLEQCSNVCKGFYICARDDEIWRQACFKVWGSEDDLTNKYISWRQMFIERPRINFHGCYISKTTYLRMGENSFQDQFYRPVHLIEYYRYIRFMTDGTVFMMTSSDEPVVGVVKMNSLSQQRSDIMRGTYHLCGDKVTIALNKQQKVINGSSYHSYGRQHRGNNEVSDTNVTKYCLEFAIMGTSKKRHCQLHWKHYSIQQFHNKIETTSVFELSPSKYPPLWFSPVRSYHSEAAAPLRW